MSSMSKYLKQTAVIVPVLLDADGTKQLDEYGQPYRGKAEIVSCRKEPYTARALTGYGQFVNYRTTYYFDEKVTVKNGYLIDGEEVQYVSEYRNGLGKLVGYEVQV